LNKLYALGNVGFSIPILSPESRIALEDKYKE
jgi:hypothetical protein